VTIYFTFNIKFITKLANKSQKSQNALKIGFKFKYTMKRGKKDWDEQAIYALFESMSLTSVLSFS